MVAPDDCNHGGAESAGTVAIVATVASVASPARPSMPQAPSSHPAPSPRDLVLALRELARDRPLVLAVRGGCMAPLVADGDRVEVAPRRRYWPGDVLVFRAVDGRLLAHRLLGYRLLAGRLAVVTRGDGCCCADAPVAPERVLGRVLRRVGVAGAASDVDIAGVEGLAGVPLPVSPAARLRAVAGFLRLARQGLRRRWSPWNRPSRRSSASGS